VLRKASQIECGASRIGAWRSARSAATRISRSAISLIRSFSLAFFACQAPPPSRSSKALFMAIAAEQFDILDRQVKLCVFGIFQHDAGMRRAQRGDRLDPQIAPDAMLDMHHQIAGRQRVDLAQEVLGLALAARLCRSAGRPAHPVRK
jgi:hypothetical protein